MNLGTSVSFGCHGSYLPDTQPGVCETTFIKALSLDLETIVRNLPLCHSMKTYIHPPYATMTIMIATCDTLPFVY